jgi:WD40 repeat protein
VAYSADGRWLAVATFTGLYIHNAEDLATPIRYISTVQPAHSIAISPDNSLLAASIGDQIYVWHFPDGDLIHIESDYANKLLFSPDSKLLVQQNAPGTTVRRVSDWAEVQNYEVTGASAFSPDGQLMALGRWADVILYDTVNYEEVKRMMLPLSTSGISNLVTSLAFSPDGQNLVVGRGVFDSIDEYSGKVEMYDIQGDVLLYSIDALPYSEKALELLGCDEHYQADSSPNPAPTRILFSPDGNTFSVLYNVRVNIQLPRQYKTVNIYRSADGHLQQTISTDNDSYVSNFDLMPSSNSLLVSTQEGVFEVWNIGDRQKTQEISGYDSPVSNLSFSVDGRFLVVEAWGKTDLLDVQNGIVFATFPKSKVAFSPDGKTLAVGDENGRISWQQIEGGSELTRFTAHAAAINGLIFATEDIIISIAQDCTTGIWRLSDGSLLAKLEPYLVEGVSGDHLIPLGIEQLLMISDETILLASFGSTFGLWQIADGKFLGEVFVENYSESAIFISNTNHLAVAGTPLELWAIEQGKLDHLIWSAGGFALSIASSPMGQLLATGGRLSFGRELLPRHPLEIWNVQDGALLHQVPAHYQSITAINFSPDGRFLATGSSDGTVRLWGIP